ncbi:DUF3310 domain-containing protein [Streptomyces sp. NRRL F-2580]|uniref:DUF3310 domain-containing protein n=1 Tax=Streptomyces sp. NRRL F-2580 TaxID=1463841 RepID=UPI0006919B92|nr:DUF3310 domain-containing protein [Streptomyces sp. NRRL F-2580]
MRPVVSVFFADKKLECDTDPVSSPSHYTQGAYEVIDIIQASMTHEAFLGYLLGNQIKYLMRCQYKHQDGGIQDLKKLTWYANKYIECVGQK